jgi:hypothetical protein
MPLSRMRFSHRSSSGSAASMDCDTKPERLMYSTMARCILGSKSWQSSKGHIVATRLPARTRVGARRHQIFDTPGNFGRFSDAIPAPRSGAEFAASLSSSRFSDASSLASRLP